MGRNRRILTEREKKLRSLILLVAFMGILLIASTYAWFSTQRAVTLSNISGIVNVAEGLEISLDAQNWSNAIDLSTVALNAVTTTDKLGSYSATANHVPSELKPASTIGTTGGTGLTLYTGTFDGQALNEITACDESVGTVASANYAGYYAFDIFLRDSSAGTTDQQLLISAGSQAVVLSTGGDDTTGLQNTVRLALAEYSATTDIGAFQEEIVNTTTGSSSTISQVAIWEPNANYHVHYMVQNASRYGFNNPSRNKTVTTYAINDTVGTTTIANVYETTASLISERLTAQTTNQTTITVPTTDSDDDGLEDLPTSYALAEKTALTDTANQAFAISANKITRLRVYVWLEGQDVDCVNYASHGGGIEIDLGIEKGGTETSGYVSINEIYDADWSETEKLHIGDFVNYDAGIWTSSEIAAIQTGAVGSLVTANGSTDKPSTAFQFGGFTAGSSRNGNATPYSTTYNYIKNATTSEAITGWRIFDIENDGTVVLISAGNPEDYYHSGNTNYGYYSEYILTGQANSSSGKSVSELAELYQKRDWSAYVNTAQKATSATVLTKSKLDSWYSKYMVASANIYTSSTFQKIYSDSTEYQTVVDNYSYYWLSEANNSGSVYSVYPNSRHVRSTSNIAFGVRVLVSLSSNILFTANRTGTITLTGGNMDTYGGNQTFNCWEIH